MLALELKSGSTITVSGDNEIFKATQVTTPVFIVKTITPGITVEFYNSSGGEHGVGYGVNVDRRFDVHFIRADGTTTTPTNSYSSASGSVCQSFGH